MYIKKKVRNKIYKAVLEYRQHTNWLGLCWTTSTVLVENQELRGLRVNPSIMYEDAMSFVELRQYILDPERKFPGDYWFQSESDRIEALKKAIELTNPKPKKNGK